MAMVHCMLKIDGSEYKNLIINLIIEIHCYVIGSVMSLYYVSFDLLMENSLEKGQQRRWRIT